MKSSDENVSIGGSEEDEDNMDIQIKKYKDLLKDVKDDGSKEDDFDMEITWEPGRGFHSLFDYHRHCCIDFLMQVWIGWLLPNSKV